MSDKLFAVETGPYGGSAQKPDLEAYRRILEQSVDKNIASFMERERNLGLFTISSIASTQVSVAVTEIYLSRIFKYARDNRANENTHQILVVLEEAHTVVPEAYILGLEDKTTKSMIGQIAQIALQGRKYRVGLLVITQRTAIVSKSILTQCNTMIAFRSFDETGKNFMSNFYGEQANVVSSLGQWTALVYGKGIKSE